MSTLPKTLITPEQYLEIERKAEFKSEYVNGEMLAMSGASRWHDWINSQLTLLIGAHLRGGKCVLYTANMRVLARRDNLYTYPDLSVVCGQAEFLDAEVDTLTNPTLLVEILSPSTEAYNRGKKAGIYRRIPSLRELLLIEQDRFHVELQRREAEAWTICEADGLDSSIELKSIAYTLRLRELYETVLAHAEPGQFGQTAP